ncbi:hypothetical protein SDC9_62804 [bioreactor metagenome]|uniref:PKD domain-containing protein n=1 Tax=bioreactor metagenome TaxID=1076179 RepID=A0A644XJS4_9ZZZZ
MKNKIVFFALALLPLVSLAQAPGCPFISGSNDTTTCGTSSVTLYADVLQTGATTSYTVSSIPFAPPYPVTSGTAFSLGTDDIWSSSPISLPFNFCFFGQAYNQVWVGSNGVLTFTNPNSTYCPWSFTASVPSSSLILNAVFGVYQDIDPSVCGTIRYAVLGTYPCRTFVFNFYQVCHFSCTSLMTTSQMVLYEGTNAIEIYVTNKPLCSSWNSGNAIIGIQNSTGTLGYTPPGRNTGAWSASNEAWRFLPSGAPNYTISWFANSALIGYGPSITVSPTTTTDYIALVAYDNCDMTQYIDYDTMRVSIGVSDIQVTATDTTICFGESTTLNASGASIYLWSSGGSGASETVSPTTNTTYYVTGTDATGCEDIDTIDIFVNPLPNVALTATPAQICNGDSAQMDASGAVSYSWSSLPGNNGSVLVGPTSTTTYTVTGTDANGCSSTAQATVTVNEIPVIKLFASPEDGCEDLFVQFTADVNPPATIYNWSFSDGVTSNAASPTRTFNTPGKYDATLDVITADGCEDSETEIGIVNVYELPVSNFVVDSPSVTMDNPVVNFTDMSSMASSYFWTFGDYSSPANYSNEANPVHAFSGPGDYIVWQTVYSDNGCSDSSYTVIHVELNMAFYIPNAFSPYNEDGVNDIFQPFGIGIGLEEGTYSMLIFNRWGRLIFKSEDIDYGWNGKVDGSMAAPGVYSYRIEVKFGDGLWHVYNGKITLIE